MMAKQFILMKITLSAIYQRIMTMTTGPYIEEIETAYSEGMIIPGAKATVFRLTPRSRDAPWILERYTGQEYVNALDRNFEVKFKATPINISPSSSDMEPSQAVIQEIMLQQRATFIVEMNDEDESYDVWRFWQNGVVFSDEADSFAYSITTQVKNQGKMLIITVDNVRETYTKGLEDAIYNVGFRFVAAKLNNNGGGELLNTVYYSQDPRIVITRPTNP